ncbi:hypothetical protein [Cytobacillus sp.]|uniref:hypothetical protein n=1 Tax=Cytobacillus sp. TaxID=2675269 RepID=UPI0028BE89AE|nr:hypothetical protein [Cytobacillus sp.]
MNVVGNFLSGGLYPDPLRNDCVNIGWLPLSRVSFIEKRGLSILSGDDQGACAVVLYHGIILIG